jgi:hypothetical protein
MTQLLTVNRAMEARMKLTPQNTKAQAAHTDSLNVDGNKTIEQSIKSELNPWYRKLRYGLLFVAVFALLVSPLAKARSNEEKKSKLSVDQQRATLKKMNSRAVSKKK